MNILLIQTIFNTDIVEQVGNKQLYIATLENNRTVLISYKTIVGVIRDGIWNLTTFKYSKTTSKQLYSFAKSLPANQVIWGDDV